VLDLLLSDKVVDIVSQLIGGTPLLFNGLNMERGSQQRFHFDTLYMAPRSEDRMVVLWFALEDVAEGSGELQYYPGSHRIMPFHFSHGGLYAVSEEMGAFDRYIETQLDVHQLKSVKFRCNAGDVFIWHSQLYHGGSAIEDDRLTRKSMVAHYWRVEDMPDELHNACS
jgi:ectoine hydroxylase-related dioxygenase (phytanoyl-CoA dioxygenase family)